MSSPSPAPSPCVGTVTGGTDVMRVFVEDWLCGRRSLPEVPKDINMTWTFVECDGASGSSYCTYRNTEGSDLILRVPNAPPNAINEVRVDQTLFPADADAYARHFVEAWVNGNTPRMRALSNPEVAAFAAANNPPTDGYSITRRSGVQQFEVASAGRDYVIALTGQLGHPNAITDVDPG